MAALLVPTAERAEWLAEWRSELWYVGRAARPDSSQGCSTQLVRFCLGSFEDAWLLAAGARRATLPVPRAKGSARECVTLLAALLALSVVVAITLPNVRLRLAPSRASHPERLVLIEDPLGAEHGQHTLSAAQYLTWSEYRQHIFQSFSFYRVGHATLAADSGPVNIRLARATENTFSTLGLTLEDAEFPASKAPGIILSAELWRTRFHADASVIGRTARLDDKGVHSPSHRARKPRRRFRVTRMPG